MTRALALQALIVTLDDMSLPPGIVLDLLIEAVISESVVNNTAEASGFFGTSVGKQSLK